MSDPTIRIIHLDPATLAALAAGDRDRAEQTSPVELSDWLAGPECTGIWTMRAAQVLQQPEDLAWVTGVVWDEDAGLAVGRAGFHAAPSEDGMVEVGYAIDPGRRRRGYARACLSLLIARARREPAVAVLRATISPSNAASLALLSQFPFLDVGEQWDDEDGLEIIYELPVD